MTDLEKSACTDTDCELHGHTHPGCTSHVTLKDYPDGPDGRWIKTGVRPCRLRPLTGQTVCRSHGGATTQAREAGEQRQLQAAAARQLRKLFPDPHDQQLVRVDPTTALLDLISWKHAEVLALRERVAAVGEVDLTWGTTSEVDKESGEFPGTDTTRSSTANVWWSMLRTAEDQLLTFSAAAHRAGIADQQIRLAQGQVQLAMDVIRDALGLALAAIAALLGDRADELRAAWPQLQQQVIVQALQSRAARLEQTGEPA